MGPAMILFSAGITVIIFFCCEARAKGTGTTVSACKKEASNRIMVDATSEGWRQTGSSPAALMTSSRSALFALRVSMSLSIAPFASARSANVFIGGGAAAMVGVQSRSVLARVRGIKT